MIINKAVFCLFVFIVSVGPVNKIEDCRMQTSVLPLNSSASGLMLCVRLHLQHQNKTAAFFIFGINGQCAVHF